MALPNPPQARPDPVKTSLHDDVRIDEYAWLRRKDDPEVVEHLQAENAFAAAWFEEETGDLRERLFHELRGLIKETDDTAPAWAGPYRYYARMEEGRPYRIYCRAPREGGDETILFDLNEASGGGFIQTRGGPAYGVSPSHRYIAYGVDRDGGETYVLEILDTETMTWLPDRVGNASGIVAWIDDDRFLYTTLDETHRPDRVWEHVLGRSEDRLVFHEPDGRRWTRLRRTRDGRWLVLSTDTATSGETRIAPVTDPDRWTVVRERRKGVEYDVETQGDRLFIRTNDGAPEFRLCVAQAASPSEWETFVEGRDDVTIEDLRCFDGFVVTLERSGGLNQVVVRFDDGRSQRVDFPDAVYDVGFGENLEFETGLVRVSYSALNRPRTEFDLDVATGELHVVKVQEIPGGFDPEAFETLRMTATASDGTEIPISIVRRRDVPRPGPLFLYGYGAYGYPLPLAFSVRRVPLLERGVTFALAHVRGGGDLGERWRNDGKFLVKKNTFTDFVACADHLVAEGWTTPDRLAIGGGSAGGLLIGAVLNLRPDLCRAAVAWVPFVDALNSMLDASLPLTENEYEEWGNPNEPEFYAAMRAYSPYDNVPEGLTLPDVLATAGYNDPRVGYWEPAKWVQRLRQRASNRPLVLLDTNMGAGHAGAADRYEELREVARDWAFVLHRLGVEPGAGGP